MGIGSLNNFAVASPRIAVVTATCNRLEGLQRLHRSLSRQTVEVDWLHVLIDDASERRFEASDVGSDPTVLEIHRNAENVGPLISRNTGIDVAQSHGVDLIAFVDDDDYVTEDFFEYLVEEWRSRRNIGWFVSRCRYEGQNIPSCVDWPAEDGLFDWFRDVQVNRVLAGDAMHVVSSERLGTKRFSRLGRFQREWTLLARLAEEGPFYATDRVTKIVAYSSGGLTLQDRGRAPDLISCWNHVSKTAVVL